MKALTRCGMGPCQGRILRAHRHRAHRARRGAAPAEVGNYRQRFPVKPIALGELAAMPTTSEATRAVARTQD